MSQPLIESWESLVYPQRRTVCFVGSGVCLYYLTALAILLLFWKHLNRNIKRFTTVVLIFGSLQYIILQIFCYVDFLMPLWKCRIYTRVITILSDLTDVTFDIYQLERILPLAGSTLRNPFPLKVLTWVLYIFRVGSFIAKNVIQEAILNPPLGRYRELGVGICASYNDPSLLVVFRCIAFLFPFCLFMQICYIIYRLAKDSRPVLERSSTRLNATKSIGRLLEIELGLFVFYFTMDIFFLTVLLLPNSGPYIPYGTVYNAVLPTFVIANVFCGRWVAMRRRRVERNGPQSTSPTQRGSASYSQPMLYSYEQEARPSSAINNRESPQLGIDSNMFESKSAYKFPR